MRLDGWRGCNGAALAGALLVMMFGCESPQPGVYVEDLPRLEGSVSYAQRIAMPPDAVIEVRLIEWVDDGRPGRVLGLQQISRPGNVPVPFTIPYRPSELRRDGRYAVEATIYREGRVWMTTVQPAPATLGNGAEPVRIQVQPAS